MQEHHECSSSRRATYTGSTSSLLVHERPTRPGVKFDLVLNSPFVRAGWVIWPASAGNVGTQGSSTLSMAGEASSHATADPEEALYLRRNRLAHRHPSAWPQHTPDIPRRHIPWYVVSTRVQYRP